MQTITDRLNGVVRAKVKALAFGQSFGTDVSACYAPAINEQGQMSGLVHSWLVTVSLANPMIGQPELAVSLPIQGVIPPDTIFEQATEMLFKAVNEERAKLLAKPGVGLDLSKIGA